MAAGDLDLQEIRLVVHETELGVAPCPHERARAHLELEIAPVTRVELVPGRQGRVDLRGSPVRRPRPKIRDLALGIAQPGRGVTNRAVVTLSRPDGSHTENSLRGEHQSQSSRDCRPSRSPEHEEPSFPSADSSGWTGNHGTAFHRVGTRSRLDGAGYTRADSVRPYSEERSMASKGLIVAGVGLALAAGVGALVWHHWAINTPDNASWLDPDQPVLKLPDAPTPDRARGRTYPDSLIGWSREADAPS